MRMKNLFNLVASTANCILLLGIASTIFGQAPLSEKVDEFSHISCDEYLGRMDAMFAAVHNSPNSKLYLIVYEGKEPRYNTKLGKIELTLPKFGSAEAKFRSIKKYAGFRKFPADRIKFINGGFRENLTVESWLVPVEAEPPKPTPTIKKMKYGKGKPVGFCIDCC